MKIIILGAGELGKYLASVLSHDKHDIVVLDQSEELLERLKDHLDVMTICGNGANLQTLIKAKLKNADFLIAVSGDEASNVVACQIAKHLGVKNTVCRLNSINFFNKDEDFTPEKIGLKNVVIPPSECVKKIINVLENKIVMEKIVFSHPDAIMTAFDVQPSSPVAGARIKDISDTEMLNSVRFAAILRDRKHIIPNGGTIIVPGDKVYVAGHSEKVDEVIRWNSPDDFRIKRVVIAGASRVGRGLTSELSESGYEVRVIEKDAKAGASILDNADSKVMVINGDATNKDVLIETGIDSADAFVSALDDDEDNILCAIMAKELGAKKVITVTNKAEYSGIIPTISMIDCGFSSSLVSVNTVLRQLETQTETVRIDAILSRLDAYIFEFKVEHGSPVCNKRINEIIFPLSTVLAMVFRKDRILAASGDLELKTNDIAVTVTELDKIKILEPLFAKRNILNI